MSRLHIRPEPFAAKDYAITAKKGNTALLDSINSILSQIEENGEMETIRKANIDKDIAAMARCRKKLFPMETNRLLLVQTQNMPRLRTPTVKMKLPF